MGECAFGLAHPFAGGEDAGLFALQGRGAGGELGPPEFLGGQRGLLVGVVLSAGEQAPEQRGELARDGDDRLAVAAAGTQALIEGV